VYKFTLYFESHVLNKMSIIKKTKQFNFKNVKYHIEMCFVNTWLYANGI